MKLAFAQDGNAPREIAAAAVCALVGVLLSVLPHLIWWAKTGDPVWIADNDDLLYLSIAGRAYLNHPLELRDPSTGGPTIYPWLQFVPGIAAAKALGLGPLGINLVWRVWAGLSIGVAWYVLTRHFTRRRGLALGATLVLLADVGVLYGKPLLRHLSVVADFVRGQGGHLIAGHPVIHLHWRIITPGLSLAFLLLHLWLLARARDRDSRLNLALAGIGFGFLFYTYFYYWTAAGLALVLAFVLDAERRRLYFHTAWIGGLIGLPSVVSGLLLKETTSSDWQHRTDNFLPIERFSELLIPMGAILLLGATLVWVWLRRKDLLYLWTLGAAAVALENHQIVTGLQIQNFHWSYVWGTTLSALLVLGAVELLRGWVSRSRAAAVVVAAVLVLHLGSAVVLRWIEATRTRESVQLAGEYRRYQEQRATAGAPPLTPDGVVAGDQTFVDFASVLESQRPVEHYSVTLSPAVTDAELDFRVALNAYLRGLDREQFRAEQARLLRERHWGPWGRDSVRREQKVAGLVDRYEAVQHDPAAALDSLDVRYVALRIEQAPPSYLADGWARVQHGPHWSIWRYEPEVVSALVLSTRWNGGEQ